ncbi:uncharacterized protein LOC126743191 [Anthonomus grandis grandis]|uniref:uncharacterized protein LOC126743191 n=1 Tax=Anthonomus grandis grandis TaxID=2921223 RepID=UPI002165CE29|nr:uncharacterized protein LOC126743191 [Anthonomus grandis grandis]
METDTDVKDSINTSLPDPRTAEWPTITEWLKSEFTPKALNCEFSETITNFLFETICRTLNHFNWYNCLEPATVADTLTETLKALRLYITNEKVAIYLLELPDFYVTMDLLMKCLFTKRNGPEVHTKYLLQFFLNMLSSGDAHQKMYAKEKIKRHELFKNIQLIFCNEFGHLYEASALVYNLLSDSEIDDPELIGHIVMYYSDNYKTNEFLGFLVENIIFGSYMWNNYAMMPTDVRVSLLSSMRDILMCPPTIEESGEPYEGRKLPDICLNALAKMLQESHTVVFQVAESGIFSEEEVSRILELLAHLSSDDKYLPFLQNDKNLLINAGVLLINAHRLGKQKNNVFSPVQKLSEIQMPGDELRRNPVFGFKADLVRLIGNLCWKNKKMQDLAREAELIPVLLDCCNMDAKNPFIIQWAILAIRNLCEQNNENQTIISSLTQRGVVSSEILEEFGLTLHTEESISIGMINLDLNK